MTCNDEWFVPEGHEVRSRDDGTIEFRTRGVWYARVGADCIKVQTLPGLGLREEVIRGILRANNYDYPVVRVNPLKGMLWRQLKSLLTRSPSWIPHGQKPWERYKV